MTELWMISFLVGLLLSSSALGAPWQDGSSDCPGTKFSSRNFVNFGCGQPFPTFHHMNGGNILRSLPPGSNTTLIPIGQVLIPTGKEVCCCRNQNQQNNGGDGMMFGGNPSGYGSNMEYGNYGQGYGNFMNNGYTQGGNMQGQGYGYNAGNQMAGGYPTNGDYNPYGGGPDGCCPCYPNKRRRRSVNQLLGRLMRKRLPSRKSTKIRSHKIRIY